MATMEHIVTLEAPQLKAAVRVTTSAIVAELAKLPRVVDYDDGSSWIDAESVDALIARLTALTKEPG